MPWSTNSGMDRLNINFLFRAEKYKYNCKINFKILVVEEVYFIFFIIIDENQ